jgi:hypothetical protein
MIARFAQTGVFGYRSHGLYPSVTSSSKWFYVAKDVPRTGCGEDIFLTNFCSHLGDLWICFSNNNIRYILKLGIIYLHWNRFYTRGNLEESEFRSQKTYERP